MQNDSNRPSLRRLTQFSLRSLLLAMMFVAAYFAGWMSHRAWNRQNVADTISRAVEEANIPVKVDHLEGVDVFVTRGRKEDVEKVTAIIDDIEDAARK